MHKTAELYYQNLEERLTNYRDVIYRKYDENKDMPQLAQISEAESSVIERVLEIIEDVYDETETEILRSK